MNTNLFVLHCKVGSLEDAEKAMNAGVDAIIIQAKNAGGHVLGQVYWQ